MKDSRQVKTKTGKKVINKDTKLPIYTKSVDQRIKEIKAELTKGMTKQDAIWYNICSSVKFSC